MSILNQPTVIIEIFCAGDGFTDFNYTYYYDNIGTGYTFKLGAIYRPIETLRIGFAFHSPTFFRINEYD